MRPDRLHVLVALSFVAIAGCGGSPTAPSYDQVFYLHGGGVIDRNYSWEVYYQPLDLPQTERVPRVVGVGILNGDVRLGRPIDWYIRGADYTPMHRFISYQSPRQFLFSIYERIDGPEDQWPEVERRFEADIDAAGSEFLGARMPFGSANGQGRIYLLKTRVPSRPEPYQSVSHEVLLRGEHRVLLVQVVHPENIESSADEILAALKSITLY